MIDHLSASQLSRFTRCAEMWRRQYIEGDIVPVGAAAHIGQAVHKAAEINFRQKIQSHTDLLPMSSRTPPYRNSYGPSETKASISHRSSARMCSSFWLRART